MSDNTIQVVKHGGCVDCGSKEQEILVSIPTVMGVSKAVCNQCLSKIQSK